MFARGGARGKQRAKALCLYPLPFALLPLAPSGLTLCIAQSSVGRMKIDEPAAYNGRNRCALHCTPVEGCIATLRLRLLHVKYPFKLRIEDRHIGVSTGGKRSALLQVEYT